MVVRKYGKDIDTCLVKWDVEYAKTSQHVYLPNGETLSVDTLQDLEYYCSLVVSATNSRVVMFALSSFSTWRAS